jgi:Flp pilus assembly protein TadG
MKRRWRTHREQGQALVELALVLPLLVLLLAGGVEFGRAFYTYNILTKSVRNAARYVSATQMTLAGTLPADYVTNTRNLAVFGNTAGTGPRILPYLLTSHVDVVPTAGGTGQYYVTVSIDYPYSPIFSFLMPTAPTLNTKETMLFVGHLVGS